jgi:thiamine biosynthesis lipoprotein
MKETSLKETRLLMGMPVTIEIVDAAATQADLDQVYGYFEYVDAKFSTYKETSEISAINRGELTIENASADMQLVFALAELTRQETDGYFNIRRDNGTIDPSGLVKGWAIYNAAQVIRALGFQNFYVDAGGDIQMAGHDAEGGLWRVGIRNPFNMHEIVKVLALTDCGVATSGTSIRGQHIYNPKEPDQPLEEVVSLTVIGPNIYEADRFATAAFAMGSAGITFIEGLEGFAGYQIDQHGLATLTTNFAEFVAHD